MRITSAAASREGDIATRQKRYLLSMSLRTICFVGAIIAFLAGVAWLWPILIVGAVLLPYLAVVMANATATRSDGFALVDHGLGQRQLGGRSESQTQS
ncbi:DUF3099 domain-containing protein [Nocardioides flavescens]|uniref:DUF3099 domain-containing protein n=1 Tax=Nocardioides flavescens TaxID=2691959 RepID=UPI00301CF73B